MGKFVTSFPVAWGDCDAAGIVFYPNYFYWLDSTFQCLLRDRGLGQRELMSRFGAVTPLLDAGMNFRSPVTYDCRIDVACEIAEWHERKFRITYRVECEGRLVGDGHELRGWAKPEGGKLTGASIPEEFRTLMA